MLLGLMNRLYGIITFRRVSGIRMTPETRSERLIEAAVAILLSVPTKTLNIVILNKALFYLDLFTLMETGRTATDNTYIGLEQGPVVAKYDKRLVKRLEDKGLAVQEQSPDKWEKPMRLIGEISEYRHLSEEVLSLAAEMGRIFSKTISKQVSHFSHDNPGWQSAWAGALRDKRRPKSINMLAAMQQICNEKDPWLDEPLDDELREILQSVERGEVRDW